MIENLKLDDEAACLASISMQSVSKAKYQLMRVASRFGDYPRTLIGISEAENSRSGKRSDPPRLIGDPMRAQAVLAGGTDRPLIGFSGLGEVAQIGVLRAVKGEAA